MNCVYVQTDGNALLVPQGAAGELGAVALSR